MVVLKNSDIKHFNEAKKLAMSSEYPSFKLGCVIVYKGKVVGRGVNSTKTCPTQKFYNRHYRKFHAGTKPPVDSIHAEVAALKSVPYAVSKEMDWSRAKVYIYRFAPGKPSGHGMARSCSGCMQALKDKGVRKLYYTTEDGMCFEDLGK